MNFKINELKQFLLSDGDSYHNFIYDILKEIKLNPENGLNIDGNDFEGIFKVGNTEYIYKASEMDNPFDNPYETPKKTMYNISFNEVGNPELNIRTGRAKENYIKILSTIYKKILEFCEKYKPDYIGINAENEGGYYNTYNNLTRFNEIPNYFVKNRGFINQTINSKKEIKDGKMIILKRKD